MNPPLCQSPQKEPTNKFANFRNRNTWEPSSLKTLLIWKWLPTLRNTSSRTTRPSTPQSKSPPLPPSSMNRTSNTQRRLLLRSGRMDTIRTRFPPNIPNLTRQNCIRPVLQLSFLTKLKCCKWQCQQMNRRKPFETKSLWSGWRKRRNIS